MSKAVRLAKIIEMPKPKPQFEPRQAYEQQQHANGQCQIGGYVPSLHCLQPAKHLWGSPPHIIKVCDEHNKWNPLMLGHGRPLETKK